MQLCAALPFGPQHAAIDWSSLHVFWAWERSLSAEDSAESALQRTKRALRNTQLPGVNLHPIPMEHGTARAVAGYEHELERHFQQSASIEPPPWDILLIDVGADGGLGGLLPGDPALNKPTRWAAALSHGGVGLTLRALEGARNALLIAAGPDKHSIAARARTPRPRVQGTARRLLHAHGPPHLADRHVNPGLLPLRRTALTYFLTPAAQPPPR